MDNKRRLLSLLLTVFMLLSVFSLTPFAADKADKVTIFIDGINSEDIIDATTGEVLYPPQSKNIANAVLENIPVVTKALLTGKHEILIDPVAESVNALFAPVIVDENGKPGENTKFNFTWPTEEQLMDYMKSEDPAKRIKYAFDWRLDMQTIASGIHDFIEYVMEVTGAETVSLVGCSMGSCALLSYLKMYDYEYVDSAIVLVGAVNGTNCCGEPFAGKIALDSDSLVRYVDSLVGFDLGGVIEYSLLHGINALGIIDPVVKFSNNLIKELSDAVYEKIFAETFGTVPGMWALVPAELYEQARNSSACALSEQMLERTDWYHYEVQNCSAEIMQGCLDRGIHMGIIAKYGYPSIPVIESADAMTDSIVDTSLASFGATCADVDEVFPDDYRQQKENGHDCVSPDRLVDSSTCAFCDQTWFIKNTKHADDYGASAQIINYIIDSDVQATVWDGEFPQYLVLENGNPVPLTADNGKTLYTRDVASENVWTVFVNKWKMFFDLVSAFFSSLSRR